MAFGGYRTLAFLLFACGVLVNGDSQPAALPRTGSLRGSWHLRALEEYEKAEDDEAAPAPAPAPEATDSTTDTGSSDGSSGGNSTGNSTNSTNTTFLQEPLPGSTVPCFTKHDRKKGLAALLKLDDEGLPDVSDLIAQAPPVDQLRLKPVAPCPNSFPTVRPEIKRAIEVMQHGTGMGPVLPSQISLLQLGGSRAAAAARPAAAAATKTEAKSKLEKQGHALIARALALRSQDDTPLNRKKADELLAEAQALREVAADLEKLEASAVTDLNFEVAGDINIGKRDTLAGGLEWATATLYNGKVEGNMQARFEAGMSATPKLDPAQLAKTTAELKNALR